MKEMARKRDETCLESAKNYLNCGDVQNAKATAIEGRRCGPLFLRPGGTGDELIGDIQRTISTTPGG